MTIQKTTRRKSASAYSIIDSLCLLQLQLWLRRQPALPLLVMSKKQQHQTACTKSCQCIPLQLGINALSNLEPAK